MDELEPIDPTLGTPVDPVSETGALALSAAGRFAQLLGDPQFGRADFDDVAEIAAIASTRPDLMALAMGRPVELAAHTKPQQLYDNLLGAYASAFVKQSAEDADGLREQYAATMKSAREDCMFAYAGLSPERQGQVMFDAANGDDVELRAVKDRFYLG